MRPRKDFSRLQKDALVHISTTSAAEMHARQAFQRTHRKNRYSQGFQGNEEQK